MGWNEFPTEFMGWSPVFQNVTLFGSRALADVIKLRWDHTDVVWAPNPVQLVSLWKGKPATTFVQRNLSLKSGNQN